MVRRIQIICVEVFSLFDNWSCFVSPLFESIPMRCVTTRKNIQKIENIYDKIRTQ